MMRYGRAGQIRLSGNFINTECLSPGKQQNNILPRLIAQSMKQRDTFPEAPQLPVGRCCSYAPFPYKMRL